MFASSRDDRTRLHLASSPRATEVKTLGGLVGCVPGCFRCWCGGALAWWCDSPGSFIGLVASLCCGSARVDHETTLEWNIRRDRQPADRDDDATCHTHTLDIRIASSLPPAPRVTSFARMSTDLSSIVGDCHRNNRCASDPSTLVGHRRWSGAGCSLSVVSSVDSRTPANGPEATTMQMQSNQPPSRPLVNVHALDEKHAPNGDDQADHKRQ
jgi:hypothetical protein